MFDDYDPDEAREAEAEYQESLEEPEDDLGDTRESDWLSSGGRANYRGRRP